MTLVSTNKKTPSGDSFECGQPGWERVVDRLLGCGGLLAGPQHPIAPPCPQCYTLRNKEYGVRNKIVFITTPFYPFLLIPYFLLFIPSRMYSGPLYICADHAGYQLKKRLVRFIENELNMKVEDLGPHEYNELDDFPDYVIPAAIKTVETTGRLIACCGSANGEAIAANKVNGMHMAVGYNIDAAELSIKHNNANGLALAARVLTEEHAMTVVKRWLETTDVLGDKYERRNKKIKAYEERDDIPKA
ncbi:MAG: hypothetical protein COU35_00340 [Candidatus Magasanikbacteria bacterium CG10_big_fil_rev_8_21_14_0_10_47_10]|uniref:Ribose-5-phosphate isomerase n=1 Tax=Candidatus Magasanikbacteria bacterium CG10_big_fil_rev_8_21_14_0_10_47_10 TaxID=1974652 RepID=A0A2H0TRP0_9BACT|nr:MAG: hypothetical protein COU35_00340 [Candidatus Magasanikbacteria bacterium CG10_big_fil_rev_8_21_14_0_10_47_10]